MLITEDPNDEDTLYNIVALISLSNDARQFLRHMTENQYELPFSVEGLSKTEIVAKIIEVMPRIQEFMVECPRCHTVSETSSFTDVIDNEIEGQETTVRVCNACCGNMFHQNGRYYTSAPAPTQLGGYHGYNRSLYFKNINWKDSNLFGIEIETYINGDMTQVIKEACVSRKVLPERDSSLDSNRGVEFIFCPTNYHELIKEGSFLHNWCKVMQKYKCQGWTAPVGNGSYGMHVSINAGAMSELHIGKFCHFIHGSSILCEKISGRSANRYARFEHSKLTHFRQNTDKYLAARRDAKRIEVRCFKSTLSWERIVRNCEFVHAVLVFTKEASVRRLNVENFLVFLDEERNYKQYRYLRKFLGLIKTKKELVFEPEL